MERGVDRISAEELTVPPGMDELFSLLRLQAHHESGEWDTIIVDCAPTGETLRLLSFPDVARWWIEKVFPMERQILAAARPIARSLLDIPLPSQAVFADIQRLSQNLIAMNEILRDRERSHGPPRDEPRQDGDRGGDADVHLPEPVRLPDRRGGRQSHLPLGRRRLLRVLAAGPGGASGARALGVRAGTGAVRAVLRAGGRRAPQMLDRLADALFAERDPADGPVHRDHAGARRVSRTGRGSALRCRLRARATSRSRRSGSS